MMIAHKLDALQNEGVVRETEGAPIGYAPVLGLLLFLWLMFGALLLVATLTPQHGGATPHQLEDLLPTDPMLWSGITP